MSLPEEPEAADTHGTNLRCLSPIEIGGVVRRCRELHCWTQETLAELSKLDVRTIQRIEKGQPSSLDTRRALARAFGSEDIDVFDKPREFPTEEQLRRRKNEYDRKYALIDAVEVTGRVLAVVAEGADFFTASCSSDIPSDVAEVFAELSDQLRDYGDLLAIADLSYSERLAQERHLDETIDHLKHLGFLVYAGERKEELVATDRVERSSLTMKLAYLTIMSADHPITKFAVERSPTLSF